MAVHGDLVQENFVDSYRNLTLKTLMAIRWASTYCSNANFVLKIDDDVLVNPSPLLEYLDNRTNLTNTCKLFLYFYELLLF